MPHSSCSYSWSSELQSALASAVCQSSDAACVLVTCAVEDNSLDAGSLSALGDQFAGLACFRRLVAVEPTEVSFHRGCRNQGVAFEIVHDLSNDVLARAGDHET